MVNPIFRRIEDRIPPIRMPGIAQTIYFIHL